MKPRAARRSTGWMGGRACSVLLGVAAAAGAADELPGLLDAAGTALEPVTAAAFGRMTPEARLRARGADPALYRAPPEEPDAVPQAGNIRHLLVPGFRYEERLAARQRAAEGALRRATPEALAQLIAAIPDPSPAQFRADHAALLDRSAPLFPGQRVQALRHSERQFARWLVERAAQHLRGYAASERARALDVLVDGLANPDAVRRRRCASLLGRLDDPLAASALERRVPVEDDARVLAELVAGRAARNDERLPVLLRDWAGLSEAHARAVVRACHGRTDRWVAWVLRAVARVGTGRVLDDLRAAWPEAAGTPPVGEGTVTFYGIATHSRSIVFCIDLSTSMAFPMEGKGAEGEPRIDRTRRELLRTLGDLPDGTRFGILGFAGGPVPWRPSLVAADAAQRDGAIRFLDRVGLHPGTNVHDALDAALRTSAGTIFLLTDGESNGGAIVQPALIWEEIADRNDSLGARIHTIGLGRDQNAELLCNLAARNGGEYVAVRK